jgi:hypothetical protein
MRDPNRIKCTPEEERMTAETLAEMAHDPAVQHDAPIHSTPFKQSAAELTDVELVQRMADAGLLPPDQDD